ncbi:MAG: hypothetical protein ABGY75_01400 [Gemmataceae bacterium]
MTALLLASLALTAPVPKATSPELKWRFKKGDVFYVQYEQEATSTVNGAGAVQGNVSATTVVYKFTVTSAAESETVLELECVSTQVGHGVGGQGVKKEDIKAAVGKTVTVTLDAKQTVTKVAGGAELAKAGGQAEQFLSEDGLKHTLTDLLTAVPVKTVGKGEKWSAETEATMMLGLTEKKTIRGVMDGITDGVAKLTSEVDRTWTGTANAGGGGPGPGITYDLKSDKGQAMVWFDTRTGRLQKREESYTMAGGINVGGVGGAAQQINLTASVKCTVTVSDKPPKD